MTEAILGVTGALYGWLLTYLFHSALMLGAVWLLVRARRVQRPATQDVLWKVGVLGSLITATAVTLRDAPQRREATTAVAVRAVAAAPASASGVGGAPSDPSAIRWHGHAVQGAVPAEMLSKVARPTESCRAALESPPQDPDAWPHIVGKACSLPRSFLWQHGVVFLWILGAFLPLAGLIRRNRALLEGLGALASAGPRARAALARVTAGTGVKAKLLTSATAGTPCVIRRNVIVLPDRCEEQLTDEELDAVLAHELAHVKRRDVVWLTVLRAVEAAFWIQPLNRVGVTGALVATELECDDYAVARTGRPLGLARSLARVAEWSLPQGGLRPEVALAQGHGRHLSQRVKRILSPRNPEAPRSRWATVAAAFLLVAPPVMLPSVPAAPVVRTPILYPAELADGNGPAFMLLHAVNGLEVLPVDLETDIQSPESEAAEVVGG